MPGFADARFELRVKRARIGTILYETNGATEGAGAIQSALRAAQDLHAVEILKAQVEKQRSVIDVSRHRRHDRGGGRGQCPMSFRCSDRE